MLLIVKEKEGLSAGTKNKYIKIFEQFINYLLLDVSSPYRKKTESAEERAMRTGVLNDIQFVFETMYGQLGRKRGAGLAITKKKAAEKLMSEEELKVMLEERSEELRRTLEEDYDCYDKEKITTVRNNLIVVATIRLGRRTKEIMTMTLDEVRDAEKIQVEGDCGDCVENYVVKVYDQKDLKTGNEAPIAFTEGEYDVLVNYINLLRPKLGIDEECKSLHNCQQR